MRIETSEKLFTAPFNKINLYSNNIFLDRPAIIYRCFPKPDTQNLAICVSGIGAGKEFSALMVDTVPNLHFLDTSQCFPRYRYISTEATGRQTSLEMEEAKLNRVDNIPEETVTRFQSHYLDKTIDGDAIFYYVYGLLHSPDYKTRFSADLKKMLPRIPLFGTIKDFQAFSDAGKALAELHVGYEDVEGWPLTVTVKENERGVEGTPDDHELYRVSKMRFDGTAKLPDKTTIKYNDRITVEGFPLDAYKYIVNGKSAIEWVMERYQVTQHKDSRIINDPNDWSDDPRYILKLLQKVVSVSMKTVAIVSGLPDLPITAGSSDDLLRQLSGIDTTVPQGHCGRTKEHTEWAAICSFLLTSAETNMFDYPLTIVKREKPDFILRTSLETIGIEITEAVRRSDAYVDAYADSKGIEALRMINKEPSLNENITKKEAREIAEKQTTCLCWL